MPGARRFDPQTSHDAANTVQDVKETQRIIMDMLKLGPKNDIDIIMAIKYFHGPIASDSGIRSRRAELVQRGLVKDSGVREKLASGRLSIVWSLA